MFPGGFSVNCVCMKQVIGTDRFSNSKCTRLFFCDFECQIAGLILFSAKFPPQNEASSSIRSASSCENFFVSKKEIFYH